MIIAITKITINIPTPIPALKISPTSSQLVNENSITNTINKRVMIFCMILLFLIVLKRILYSNYRKIKVLQTSKKHLI
ncbi:hypothetical protein EV143_10589 [Flavobacterium chryseum]|nr:hypothetical protein EV143_10589 [Flavobacterium sp. P3160]